VSRYDDLHTMFGLHERIMTKRIVQVTRDNILSIAEYLATPEMGARPVSLVFEAGALALAETRIAGRPPVVIAYEGDYLDDDGVKMQPYEMEHWHPAAEEPPVDPEEGSGDE